MEFLKNQIAKFSKEDRSRFFSTSSSQKVPARISKDSFDGSWIITLKDRRSSRMSIYTVADAGFEFNFLRVRVLR